MESLALTYRNLFRKIGRTAQVFIPFLQELGKSVEHRLHLLIRTAHDKDLEGLRQIDVPSGALFLDVGANRGWATYSIFTIFPHALIIGFEPNPAMARRIVHLYGPPNAFHIVALSNESGYFPLYVPIYRGLVFDGLASLCENEARRWLSKETVFGFDQKHLEICQITCRVATLDSFNLDPFFIKIDVQGRELEVILGAIETIASSQPIIFSESQVLDIDKVLKLLAEWRYEVWSFDGMFRAGEISLTNVYFVPEGKKGRIRAP